MLLFLLLFIPVNGFETNWKFNNRKFTLEVSNYKWSYHSNVGQCSVHHIGLNHKSSEATKLLAKLMQLAPSHTIYYTITTLIDLLHKYQARLPSSVTRVWPLEFSSQNISLVAVFSAISENILSPSSGGAST